MTAEEFLKDAQQNPEKGWTAKKMLIEFAKYHVQKALEEAVGEAPIHCSKGIKNCYPLENIK